MHSEAIDIFKGRCAQFTLKGAIKAVTDLMNLQFGHVCKCRRTVFALVRLFSTVHNYVPVER